jgi:polysaccharide export outer membrane protein
MRNRNVWQIAASLLLAAVVPVAALAQATTAAVKPRVSAAAPQPPAAPEYQIAPGDVIRISVFQNPDLSLETRVAENGTISYPLIGSVPLSGNTIGAAERRITRMLHDGGFIVAPQVTIVVVQVRGNQVTVLGQVAKPGRFPLDSTDYKLTDMLALAGGIAATGGDMVTLTGLRDGKPMRMEIDIQHLGTIGDPVNDIPLQAGDMIYVNRAPNFYIYGEVQKPGVFRLDRGTTVIQALAIGGGLTPKGTQRGLTIHRRGPDGKIQIIEPKLDDSIIADDVIYIRQSIF